MTTSVWRLRHQTYTTGPCWRLHAGTWTFLFPEKRYTVYTCTTHSHLHTDAQFSPIHKMCIHYTHMCIHWHLHAGTWTFLFPGNMYTVLLVPSVHMYNTFTLTYWHLVFPCPQNVYTLHACNTVTLQLTQWHSFPLSTKHTHYTRMQHIHTPTYTLTHTLFLFLQNVHTLYVQFSSFHKTHITLYTHAHSNLHTNTYSFPLSTKHIHYTRMQHIHTPTYTQTHTIFLFPQNVHTIYIRAHIPTYTPTFTVFLLPQNIHYTIHTCNTFTFQLTHQHLQFSSCHSVCFFPLSAPCPDQRNRQHWQSSLLAVSSSFLLPFLPWAPCGWQRHPNFPFWASYPHLLRTTKRYTHQFKETSLLQTHAPSANNRS